MKLLLLVILFSASYAVDIECPGGKHECPDSATCCQLPDMSYGCCPLRKAVCCNDHIHCCPEGHECAAHKCIEKNSGFTINAIFHKGYRHICPSMKYTCSHNSTCCEKDTPGLSGCCPMPDAVCCSDGTHCCPKGTKCDLQKQKCVNESYFVDMLQFDDMHIKPKNLSKIPLSKFFSKAKPVTSVICPNGSFQCPDGYTCCQLTSESWGCCPLVQATCCEDHLHCCPEGMKCDPSSQTCSQGSRNMTWLENKKAQRISEVKINVCPGGEYKCPDGTTCCQLSSGAWGCCQYKDAVCCSDHMHCCPNGLVCNLVAKHCDGPRSVPWLEKLSAKLLSDHVND